MALGLSRPDIEHELETALRNSLVSMDGEQVEKIAQALASAMEKNNREIERNLGKKFADIERSIGR